MTIRISQVRSHSLLKSKALFDICNIYLTEMKKILKGKKSANIYLICVTNKSQKIIFRLFLNVLCMDLHTSNMCI